MGTIKFQETHIICIAETKTKQDPPKLENHEWIVKNRTNTEGGGVAIAIRKDLAKKAQQVENLETQDQEIIWLQLPWGNKKLFIGTYYGPQESAQLDAVEREYSQLQTQVSALSKLGEIILIGDFNAKLKIDKENTTIQYQIRNGKLQ